MAIPVDPIERAAQLPLNDAAYRLWMQRHQLDRSELPGGRRPVKPVDLSDRAAFEREVRRAIATVYFDRDNAHHGPTFRRLKKAHPNATDEALEAAIKLAVKFDKDCLRHYKSKLDEDPFADGSISNAIILAKEENPYFTDETYQYAEFMLRTAMR